MNIWNNPIDTQNRDRVERFNFVIDFLLDNFIVIADNTKKTALLKILREQSLSTTERASISAKDEW